MGDVTYREAMDTGAPAREREIGERRLDHILVGAAFIVVGMAVLADNADWLHLSVAARIGPFVLLGLGFVYLAVPGVVNGQRRSRRTAIWLLGIGAWGLVSEFRLLGLNYATSWPLLIITAGIGSVAKALEAPAAPRRVGEN